MWIVQINKTDFNLYKIPNGAHDSIWSAYDGTLRFPEATFQFISSTLVSLATDEARKGTSQVELPASGRRSERGKAIAVKSCVKKES